MHSARSTPRRLCPKSIGSGKARSWQCGTVAPSDPTAPPAAGAGCSARPHGRPSHRPAPAHHRPAADSWRAPRARMPERAGRDARSRPSGGQRFRAWRACDGGRGGRHRGGLGRQFGQGFGHGRAARNQVSFTAHSCDKLIELGHGLAARGQHRTVNRGKELHRRCRGRGRRAGRGASPVAIGCRSAARVRSNSPMGTSRPIASCTPAAKLTPGMFSSVKRRAASSQEVSKLAGRP